MVLGSKHLFRYGASKLFTYSCVYYVYCIRISVGDNDNKKLNLVLCLLSCQTNQLNSTRVIQHTHTRMHTHTLYAHSYR